MPPLVMSAPPSGRQRAAKTIYDQLQELSKNVR